MTDAPSARLDAPAPWHPPGPRLARDDERDAGSGGASACCAQLLDALGQAVCTTDAQGRVSHWNAASAALLGWSAEEARGRRVTALMLPEAALDLVAPHGSPAAVPLGSAVLTVTEKDGATFTGIVTCGPLPDHGGHVWTVTNVAQMLGPLLSRLREAAVITDREGRILHSSPSAERLLGLTAEQLAGSSLQDVTHAQDRPALERGIQQSLQDLASSPVVETRLRTANDEWSWLEAALTNLTDDPSVRGLLWTFRDVSGRRAALQQMTHEALHDPLTGLFNRAMLTSRLAQATTRRQAHGAVLFIDLDGFKDVNDALGHVAGDKLLQALADRLLHCVRPEDCLGRWSGDEFVLLNESITSWDEAEALSARVARAVAGPVEVLGRTVLPQASIGIAMLDGIHDPEDLIRLADEHMYRVKKQRRHEVAEGATHLRTRAL